MAVAVLASVATAGVSDAHQIAMRTATARAVSSATPTLGPASTDPDTAGFGQVKPRTISYGGDETSEVIRVHWRSWGGGRAIGQGRAVWVWPGWCVACGAVTLRATVIAFDRTTCQGKPVYDYVEWFFPSRGMSFDQRQASSNLCTGHAGPGATTKTYDCAAVTLRSASGATIGLADKITAYGGLRCGAARHAIVTVRPLKYLNHNARIHHGDWWCGSELSMQPASIPPQQFSCQRGNEQFMTFDVTPAGA